MSVRSRIPRSLPEAAESGRGTASSNDMARETGARLKAVTLVRLADGSLRRAEVHWYEAHGVGKVR